VFYVVLPGVQRRRCHRRESAVRYGTTLCSFSAVLCMVYTECLGVGVRVDTDWGRQAVMMGMSYCQRSSQHPLPHAHKAQAMAQQAYMHQGISANCLCLIVLHAWGVRPRPSRPIANHHTSSITGRSKGGSGSFPPATASVPSETSWRLVCACARDPLVLLPLLMDEVPPWRLPSCSSYSLGSRLWR
jgi:hypothetical protein